MIRIKVFPLKKIIYKLEIMLAYISFFILILVVISLLFKQRKVKSETVLSKNLISFNQNITEEKIIKNIVKNKIKIISNIDLDGYGEEKEQEEQDINISQIKKTDSEILQSENLINVKIVECDDWPKPDKYDTKLLENGKIEVGTTIINNYSKLSLDLEALKKVSSLKVDCNTSILIFHTHTSETYNIPENEYTDYYRTENERYNIISVGNALSNALISKGYNCVHDKTVHDYPSYNGAYKASLETVQKQLKNNKFDLVIDIHRDAISSNEKFRPTVEINGETVAKLMFVIGTNSGGLTHDEWMENLKFAIMIQNRANEMYPGLFRELHLSSSRYNQHVSNGAMILEVGATGNTLEEARGAMKYFAEVLDSMKQ